MSDRIKVHALDPSGAADGDSPRYDVATGRVEWATSAGGGVVESIVPGSGITVDSTDPRHPVVSATGGGGGGGTAAHSYVGATAPGGSWSAFTNNRVFYKKITLASDALLTNIEAYLRNNGTGVDTYSAAVFADASNSPGNLLSAAVNPATSVFLDQANGGRWFGIPQGIWLTTGAYWIGWAVLNDSTITQQIAYDTGGSDVYRSASAGTWFADGNFYTNAVTTNNYSIRASLLTL